MAARTGTAFVTISDLLDGENPLNAILSNQSAGLIADEDGAVTSQEISSFICNVYCYVGTAQIPLDNSSTPAKSTYRCTADTLVSSAEGWVPSIRQVTQTGVGTIAQVYLTAVNQSSTSKACTIDVPITITNSFGNTTEVTLQITLTKVIQGSGSVAIYITADRQTFSYTADGITTDNPITLQITHVGDPGVLTATKSIDQGTWSELVQGTGAGEAETVNLNSNGAYDSIVISADNFDGAASFVIKVSGAESASDIMSLIKVQDGATGASSITAIVSSSDGGTTFKNNISPASKTLSVKVYDNASGNEISNSGSSTISYQWLADNVAIQGATSSTLTITPNDVPDGGSIQYSVQVYVND